MKGERGKQGWGFKWERGEGGRGRGGEEGERGGREGGEINNTEDVSKSHRETYYFRSLPKIPIRVSPCHPG